MLGPSLPRSQGCTQLALRGSVAACRFLETLSSNTCAGLAGAQRAPPPLASGSSSSSRPGVAALQQSSVPNPQEHADSGNVLGVLTSLLQQQQQSSAAPLSLSQAAAAQDAFSSSPASSASCVRMESQLVFDSCWRRFRERRGMDFAAPREIVWLNGAPGSGKGVSAPHIQDVRGMTKSINISSLLAHAPEAQPYIAAGEMISDATVGDLVLEELLQPASTGSSTAELNCVVDGFPRTAVQVDFVKLLMDKLSRLHRKCVDTPLAAQFPRPAFKVVVLYVDEATSIQRQLQRAVAARAHNARVKDAGVSEQARLQEERPTDLDLNKATKRYQIFKQHYSAILRLKQFLPFHLIDAMGSKSHTQEQITQELRYQSSLDLSEEAYSAIRHLPLAKDLQQTARQQLVGRLEVYCSQQRPLFGRVLDILQSRVLPLLVQGALAGSAEWLSQEALFSQHPVCVDMLLDVLSDRGFKATYCKETVMVPVSIDAATGSIMVRPQPQHRFRFSLEQVGEREASMLKALEIAARITEAARSNMVAAAAQQGGQQLGGQHSQAQPDGVVGMAGLHPASPITESFIPAHLDHEAKARRGQDLRRVTLTSLSRNAPAAAAAATRAEAACSRAGCSSCTSSSSSSTPSSGAADEDEEGLYTIHRCLKPELNCGHAEELEVVAASG